MSLAFEFLGHHDLFLLLKRYREHFFWWKINSASVKLSLPSHHSPFAAAHFAHFSCVRSDCNIIKSVSFFMLTKLVTRTFAVCSFPSVLQTLCVGALDPKSLSLCWQNLCRKSLGNICCVFPVVIVQTLIITLCNGALNPKSVSMFVWKLKELLQQQRNIEDDKKTKDNTDFFQRKYNSSPKHHHRWDTKKARKELRKNGDC